MNIIFEEHAGPQRAGGIESATLGLIANLAKHGVTVTRNFTDSEPESQRSPDCVHIHGIWSPTLARRFLGWRRRGVPCIVTLHGMLEPWALAHKAFKKQLAWNIYQKRLLNMAAALHATSKRESDNLRILGLRSRIEVIPWGVAMTKEIRTAEGGSGRKVSKIDDFSSTIESSGHRTALFVGRIFPVKGLPMLVEAWANVRPIGWKMKIVGPDEAGHLAELQYLVGKTGLAADFEFTGALEGERLRNAYEESDLFILPSYTENFGMVVAEALAYGVPVIASQGTPWRGLLEHSCGWWPEISSDGLAKALRTATSMDAGELRLMGARGKNWVQRDFSWDQIAHKIVALYNSVRMHV